MKKNDTTHTAPKRTPSKGIGKLVLIAFIVSVAVGIVMWLVLGKSKDAVVFDEVVCGEDIVLTYNDVAEFSKRNGSEEYTIDAEGLKALIAEIKAKQNYQNDITCQTILLEAAIYNEDYNTATETYADVKELSSKNKTVNSNLKVTGTITQYEIYIQDFAPDNKKIVEPQGGG